jgi:uncharacterized membrane protein
MFKYHKDVEEAVKELDHLGYNTKEMSVVMKDIEKKEEMQDMGVQVTQGTASGAVTGGILGGVAGLLVGLGTITIPAIGPFLAAGPLAAALGLTGAAATTTTGAVAGAVAGGLAGALISLGFPAEEAKHYEEEIKAGGILLMVPTINERSDEVRRVLDKHHVRDVRQLDLSPDAEHLAA